MQTQRLVTSLQILLSALLLSVCGGESRSPRPPTPTPPSQATPEPLPTAPAPSLDETTQRVVLRAELVDPTLIVATLGGDRESPAVILEDHTGASVPLATATIDNQTLTIKPTKPLDLNKNYRVTLGTTTAWARLSQSLLAGPFNAPDAVLGATLTPAGTADLTLWSPPATAVVVEIFDPANPSRLLGTQPLSRGEQGLWRIHLQPEHFQIASLDGAFYQLQVTAYGETHTALDPYAKSMAAFDPTKPDLTGKAAFVRFDSPLATPNIPWDTLKNKDIMQNSVDLIGYEIHVRDFTSSPDSGVKPTRRGTFVGFADKADHLTELGVTHVQLLPIQNFFTVDETDREFQNAQTKDINFNWGYDPHNYFTPEGWYATDATDPYSRIRDLREMVGRLHAKHLGVIVDVVYNHTYRTEIFENVCPGCYFRVDDAGAISVKTGAGPTVESRTPMVRRLIVDSLKHFVDIYGINGFRFDLMGFIDKETMKSIRTALGDDIILHGEAWEFTDLPTHEAVTKSNLPENTAIGAFSDTTRDGIGGWMAEGGFLVGKFEMNHRIRSAVIGNLQKDLYSDDYSGNGQPNTHLSTDPYDRFARSPVQNLGFLSIHDGPTLWDKIHVSMARSNLETSLTERLRISKLAAAMLFTTQGRIILHGGVELARTKPVAENDPEPKRVIPETDRPIDDSKLTPDPDLPGVRLFHENSYRSSDFTNMIRWNRKGNAAFSELHEYYRKLIAMRRQTSVFRMDSPEAIASRIRFFGQAEQLPPPDSENRAGYETFADVPELTIHFINGPINQNYFMAGEVHPANIDKNPASGNPFVVSFDVTGTASLTLSRNQIAALDLRAWGNPENLQFKLVVEPGNWDALPGAYSGMGNNTIEPAAIHRGNVITIDLKTVDHWPGKAPITETPFIAFEILGTTGPYSSLIVLHNGDGKSLNIEVPTLKKPTCWRTILDENDVNFATGLATSAVRIANELVTVPKRSSAILGNTCPRVP